MLNYVFRYYDLPYVVIPKRAHDRYIDVLEAANQGDLATFTDFVAEQYERSLDQMLGQIRAQSLGADEQS